MSKDHHIARPYGRDMDVPREFKFGLNIFCIQYPVTFERDISMIYSSASSAFSPDFLHSSHITPAMWHILTNLPHLYYQMCWWRQKRDDSGYIWDTTIMRGFQHILFHNAFMHNSAFNYDTGTAPKGRQVNLTRKGDIFNWCMKGFKRVSGLNHLQMLQISPKFYMH